MEMKAVCLVAILAVLVAGAPSGDLEDRINGGVVTAEPGEFPYIVSITEGEQHLCGGFIYNSLWVVTAASCVDTKLPSQLSIVFGQWSLIQLDPNEKKVSAFKIMMNPGYNRTSKLNDLALIEVSNEIEINGVYDFLTYDEADPSYTTGTIMGWGALTTGGQPTTKLRKAQLPIVSGTTCTNYTANEFNSNFMICAGDATVRPCSFDEGGPLVYGDGAGAIAIGIYSKNRGCSNSTSPGVFTRLSPYYAWLNENAGVQPPRVIPVTTIPTPPCVNCQTPGLAL